MTEKVKELLRINQDEDWTIRQLKNTISFNYKKCNSTDKVATLIELVMCLEKNWDDEEVVNIKYMTKLQRKEYYNRAKELNLFDKECNLKGFCYKYLVK